MRPDGVVVAVSLRDTVLVLRALGLGDLLTSVPALRGLRRHYRDATLVLAAPARYRELALLTGAVDDVLPTECLGDLATLPAQPSVAVNLHGCGPQSHDHLLAWRPRSVITHSHPRYPRLSGPSWCAEEHEINRWCALLEWSGIRCESTDVLISRPEVENGETDAVVIHPGASAPARQWPVDRFAAVADALRNDGHDVLITGSAAEFDLAHAVARAAGLPRTAVLAGLLDLPALTALVCDSTLVICGDTGMAHLAAATGTASVVLFGPTAPSRWGPRGPAPHVALWAGRTGDPHGAVPDPNLLRIDTASVLAASRRMLNEAA